MDASAGQPNWFLLCFTDGTFGVRKKKFDWRFVLFWPVYDSLFCLFPLWRVFFSFAFVCFILHEIDQLNVIEIQYMSVFSSIFYLIFLVSVSPDVSLILLTASLFVLG